MLKPAKVMPMHLEGAHIVFSVSGQRMNQNRGLEKITTSLSISNLREQGTLPAATLIICLIPTKFLGLYGIYREGAFTEVSCRGKE